MGLLRRRQRQPDLHNLRQINDDWDIYELDEQTTHWSQEDLVQAYHNGEITKREYNYLRRRVR